MLKINILIKEIGERITQLENDKLIEETKKQALIRENKKILSRCLDLSGSFDWDKLAESLNDEYGSSHLTDYGDENNPYHYWLIDVDVEDIINFMKNHLLK